MLLKADGLYVFGQYRLDVRERQLLRDGQTVPLPPKAFDLLVALARRAGHLMTKEELLAEVWPGTFVEEANLSYTISLLRKTLGDEPERYIETVPKRGYRFREAAVEPATEATAPASSRLRRWPSRLGAAAILLILVVAAAVLWDRRPRADPGTPVLTRLTHDAGLQTDPTFSPDGRFIAYASNKAGTFDIWVQPVAGGEAVQVTNHPARDTQPDWSPDGSRIIFRSERDGGGLFVVPPFGGVEERVSTFGFRPIWSPDGSRFLFRTNVLGEGLGRVYVGTTNGTEPLEISQFMPGGITTAAVNWHPDGKQVSFLSGFTLDTLNLERRTVVRSEMSPATREAVEDLGLGVVRGQRFAWQPEGDGLVFSGVANEVYDLWTVTVDPQTLVFLRKPHRLTASPEHATQVAVSRDGRRVAYASTRANSVLWRYTLDGTGGRLADAAPQPLTSPEMNAFWPRVTPDRKRLLYFMERPGGRPHVHDLRSRSLTDDTDSFVRRYDLSLSMFRSRPIESWDGARSALLEGDRKTTTLRLIDRRTGVETSLTSPIPGVFLDRPSLCGWTPDSRFVVAAVSEGSACSVRLFPLAAAPRAEIQARIVSESPVSGVRLQCGDVSSAGWIALAELRVTSATMISIKVVSTDGGEPVAITDSGWAHHPAWSPDGRTLYFYRADQGVVSLWAAAFDPKRGVRLGDPYPLTNFDGTSEEFFISCCAQQIGVTQEALILPVRHPTGGIWMLEMPAKRD